jgi:hypothetical protein
MGAPISALFMTIFHSKNSTWQMSLSDAMCLEFAVYLAVLVYGLTWVFTEFFQTDLPLLKESFLEIKQKIKKTTQFLKKLLTKGGLCEKNQIKRS